jgi:hypothetical protein
MKLLACALLFASTLAFAADPAPPPAGTPTATDPAGRATTDKDTPVDCLTDTGSHIKRKPGECTARGGKVITRDDLQHTGETNTAEALKHLDPSIH